VGDVPLPPRVQTLLVSRLQAHLQRPHRDGYPLKAGQCVLSIPSPYTVFALPRLGQSGHMGYNGLKEVWKLPTKKARGWRRPVWGMTSEVMEDCPDLVPWLRYPPLIVMELRQSAVTAFHGR
jgi:hypothetical protein